MRPTEGGLQGLVPAPQRAYGFGIAPIPICTEPAVLDLAGNQPGDGAVDLWIRTLDGTPSDRDAAAAATVRSPCGTRPVRGARCCH